ncbi:hypothetical protein INT47_007087 [Mucor saturninus]|uniref:Uncharacterized protein n=1 Tax=Mucor saturninus TaxID=64648 RepID=A0A8H7URK3_9FUNG|nr:hypothetical protein INT47_007087 [Mucor saturninus]
MTPQFDTKDNFYLSDKDIQQLLSKLDEGTETAINLRSLLCYKTAQLNELVSQLQLIDQVLFNVEHGTEQIELVLKDVISAGQEKLLHAQATLDSAIKSADTLYSKKPAAMASKGQKKAMVHKVNSLLTQLGIHSHYKIDDDLVVLQKAFLDLDLAKNIATTIKSDLKHRSTLIKSKNAPLHQIQQMGAGIRKQVSLYRSYTQNAPLLINNQDAIAILDREDQWVSKVNTYTLMNHVILTNIHSLLSLKIGSRQTSSALLLISRHTTSSKAKSKEPQGPGSTLRLRNMLAKRKPASIVC